MPWRDPVGGREGLPVGLRDLRSGLPEQAFRLLRHGSGDEEEGVARASEHLVGPGQAEAVEQVAAETPDEEGNEEGASRQPEARLPLPDVKEEALDAGELELQEVHGGLAAPLEKAVRDRAGQAEMVVQRNVGLATVGRGGHEGKRCLEDREAALEGEGGVARTDPEKAGLQPPLDSLVSRAPPAARPQGLGEAEVAPLRRERPDGPVALIGWGRGVRRPPIRHRLVGDVPVGFVVRLLPLAGREGVGLPEETEEPVPGSRMVAVYQFRHPFAIGQPVEPPHQMGAQGWMGTGPVRPVGDLAEVVEERRKAYRPSVVDDGIPRTGMRARQQRPFARVVEAAFTVGPAPGLPQDVLSQGPKVRMMPPP